MPGDGTHRIEDTRGESCRRPRPLDKLEEGDGGAEAAELARAIGTPGEMGGEGGVLLDGQGLVDPAGKPVPRVVAAHGRKRSSLSLRSIRARCSRDRTVPGSRPSAVAISS